MKHFRSVRTLIYHLKRKSPIAIILISEEDAEFDFTTGKVGKASRSISIRRAVRLPKEIVRDNARFGQFTFGSDLPEASLVVLIDVKDLPSDYPESNLSNTKVQIGSKVWQTDKVKNFFDVAYQLTLKDA